jgi:predicted permease
VRFVAFLGDARCDLRHAARLFARQPAILLLAIVGLSLGLGIATAAFSIMNAAVLRGEGLVDPDRAPGVLRTTDRSTATTWRYDELIHLREGATRMQVEGVLTEAAPIATTAAIADAPSANVAFVSEGFFAATGGRVIAGRPLVEFDARHNGPPPVVVSFTFWTMRLNQDPAVIGKAIRVGRTTATIVGIAARGFSVPNRSLLWMPLTAYGAVYDSGDSDTIRKRTPEAGVEVFGRLLPDVALAEAEAQLSAVAATLPMSGTSSDPTLRVTLDPDAGLGRASSSDALAIAAMVFAVIALVLLLAVANVSSVLIATAITREREIGVRAALGARRGRLVRQLVTESLALGAIAALLAVIVTSWAIPVIGTMLEAPAGADLAPDLTVYVFLGLVTLVSGVGAGLAPAWHGRGTDLVTALKGEGAHQNRVAPRRLRSLLVTIQAVLSVALIVLAMLFVRAAVRGAAIDVGFDATGLYAVSPGPGDAIDADPVNLTNYWSRAKSELQAVPGVRAVTVAELTPFDGLSRTSITREEPSRVIYFTGTHAEYFETMGLRILAGRAYTRDEVATKAPVALISHSLARAYWQDQSPLGQALPSQIPVSASRPVIIGVVADAITARVHDRNTFAVYEPIDPANAMFAQLLIRTEPGAPGAINLASQRLRSIDPQANIQVASVAARLQQETDRPRILATLTGIVGIVAIVLSVIGLYGLTASVVRQRAREMGVRVAMGAEPRDLLRLLMWDSLKPVVVGLAAGAASALLASRVVESTMLFGVSPQDPMAFAGAAAILLAAATLAVLVPARSAASVDAAVVLRRG